MVSDVDDARVRIGSDRHAAPCSAGHAQLASTVRVTPGYRWVVARTKPRLCAGVAAMNDSVVSASPVTPTTAIVVTPRATSYLTVAGVPLLRRTVLSAQRAGATVVLVQRGADARARRVLDRDARTRSVELIDKDRLVQRSSERVLVIASDCLVTTKVLDAIQRSVRWDGAAGVRADGAMQHRWAVIAGHRSQLQTFIALVSGCGCADAGEYTIETVPGVRIVHLESPSDSERAEDALVAELRASTTDTDGPIARLDRAVSIRLSRVLLRTPIRPNHITAAGTCIGLLGAWALAQGQYWYGVLGALLFWIAVIIDGCDGEVARLKFLESRFGQLFDVITDNVVHVAIFAGIAVGAYRDGRVEQGFLFAATLIVGFLCASAATSLCLLSDGPVKHLEISSRRGRLRRRVLQVFEALMNRDFAYLLAVLALVDRLHWFLWGTVFGTYAYAAGLVWVYRWSDRPRSSHASAEPANESTR